MGKNLHTSFDFPKPCNFFYSESCLPKGYAKFSEEIPPPIFDMSTKQESETRYSLLKLQFVKYSIYAIYHEKGKAKIFK